MLAIIFPGQGSQSIGMLSELAEQYPSIKETFAEASAVLNYDLWELCQQGPEDTLNQTDHTQPALLTAGIAVYRLLQQQFNMQAAFFAGHSLGEYTALVAAAALEFTDAVKLVRERGRCMQSAVPTGQGGMAALVGLTPELVNDICKEASQGDVLSPANYNSVGQIVIAGTRQAIDRAITLGTEKGAKLAAKLPVSVPSHCALMEPAAEEFSAILEGTHFNIPQIPIINNVDVKINSEPADIQQALMQQLYNPVRWVETIEFLKQRGVNNMIECGPGKVLTGLNKRIDRSIKGYTTLDATNFEKLKEIL